MSHDPPDRHQRISDLFLAVCECAAVDRAAFLDEACAGDPALRAEVESLLDEHGRDTGLLRTPKPASFWASLGSGPSSQNAGDGWLEGPSVQVPPSGGPFPERIGSYRILGLLGEGGMGVVYLAEQERPRRTVALKIIRPGLASPAMLRRFEHEAQVLGWLQHPGIAQIIEAGTADTGHGPQPFFAMERIEGEPLTRYAEAKRLGTRERLELIAKVCDAVQHAHQKGVIHRDLKPANILVVDVGAVSDRDLGNTPGPSRSETAPTAQPKVLDFGVARAIDADIQTTTLATDMGQLIGTIPYMSPEQVAGDPHDVDVRSDVYSLGVVAYELLAGRLPYPARNKSIPEALRLIREEDPTPLSSINRLFRGDLETIVGKALDKDKTRRYQSASDLAADIRHYLSGEPIEAKRDSAWYVFKMTVRRHKVAAGMLASFVLLVIASTVALSFMYGIQKRERQRSDQARYAEAQARLQAEAEAVKAGRIQDFLQNMVAAADPDKTRGRQVTVGELLDQAAIAVPTEFTQQPEVEAALRATIGRMYESLGLYQNAEPHFRAALAMRERIHGHAHPDVGKSLKDLGNLSFAQGDMVHAGERFREALAVFRQVSGSEHEDVAETLRNLGNVAHENDDYATAERLHRDSLAMTRKLLGVEHLEVSKRLNDLAALLQSKGDYVEAEELYRQSLAMVRRLRGHEHSEVAACLGNLGMLLLHAKGDYVAAEALLRESLAICRKILGDQHPSTAGSMYNVAVVLQSKGDHAAAEPLLRECLSVYRGRLGDEHVKVAGVLNGLAYVLKSKGDLTAAEPLYREALAILRNLQVHETDQATCLDNLASLLREKGDDAAAVPLHLEAIAIYRKLLGNEHKELAASLGNLAVLLYIRGEFPAAESPAREALAIRRKALPEAHPHTAENMVLLGAILVEKGDPAEAEPLLRECLDLRRRVLPQGAVGIAQVESVLGRCLTALKRYEEAEPLLTQSYPVIKAQRGEHDRRTREVLRDVINLYEIWGKPDRVAEYRATEAQPAP